MSGKGVLINVSFQMEKESERKLYTTSRELARRRLESTFQLTPGHNLAQYRREQTKFTSSHKSRATNDC
jgi:hypothetical protein